MGDDPCECFFSHTGMMQRLLRMVSCGVPPPCAVLRPSLAHGTFFFASASFCERVLIPFRFMPSPSLQTSRPLLFYFPNSFPFSVSLSHPFCARDATSSSCRLILDLCQTVELTLPLVSLQLQEAQDACTDGECTDGTAPQELVYKLSYSSIPS
jgi:hypothetical protein